LLDSNYMQGDINKFITLDSVHFGSFLADYALDLRDSLNPILSNIFVKELRGLGMDIEQGAIEDLRTNSYSTEYMNIIESNPNPRSHAIVGDFVWNSDLADIPGKMGELYGSLKKYGIDTVIPISIPGESDLVVSAESQAGGMGESAKTTLNHYHTAATTIDVFGLMIDLLNADLDSSLFEDGFPVYLYPYRL